MKIKIMKKSLLLLAILLPAMLLLGSCSGVEPVMPESAEDASVQTRTGLYYDFQLRITDTSVAGRVSMEWNSLGAELHEYCGYKIMRKVNNGTYSLLATLYSWNITQYTDTSVRYGNRYEYQIIRGWWDEYTGVFSATEFSTPAVYNYGYTDPTEPKPFDPDRWLPIEP